MIIKAQIKDAQAIQNVLFESVGGKDNADFEPYAWEKFKVYNSLNAIENRIKNIDYKILCYFDEQKIIGFISMFQLNKIDHLFVIPNKKRQGIAKKLWLHVINNDCSDIKKFWVRSSTEAVAFYLNNGFKQVANKDTSNGISFYLMEKEVTWQKNDLT